jgi:diaminopimelate decarboxylase
MDLLESRARALRRKARVSVRVNPDVDPKTHPYISTGMLRHKFGMATGQARRLCIAAARSPYLDIVGVGFHIGSQITTIDPFVQALVQVKKLVLDLRASGVGIRHLDLGGGLGITYNDELPPKPEQYGKAVVATLGDLDCMLLLEPGRVIVGNAGILVTTVLLTKKNGKTNFVVVDAGMTELIRPTLYGSYHAILPERSGRKRRWTADVVGPVCESGDFLARARQMPTVRAGDLLAIMSAGAYGFVLSSNYNSRPRVPEVLVHGNRFKVIRKRESFADMIGGEVRTPL